MKKSIFPVFISCSLVLLFLIQSCSHNFYAPTTAQTPLFRQKGEAQLSAHLGNGNEIDNSQQIQTAYAFDSSWSVAAGFFTGRGGFDETDEKDNNGKGSQFELALGYFKPLSRHISYEVYAGSAYGMVNNKYNNTYEIKNNFIKPFVQGNLGYRSSFVDLAATLRVGWLHISNISERNDTGFVATGVDIIKSQPNSFLLEPGLTLRVGYEPIKMQLHLGRSFNMSNENYPQESTVFSVGIVGMIHSSTRR